ncbi:uncharacterized protein LOC116164716 isoform X2 [Photinus pyralis]|nr:uncharacterized protein LOC116164716 isoform X2 [Photinus pyralis]
MSVMDCCNYLQYKQSFYRPQFYENGFYNRDYYGHPYQSYYAHANYYSQQWPNSASLSDYVYNPKEARIRKAMRESSRDQTLGAAPTTSPRGGRRTQTWLNGPEEHLMMTPPPPDLSSQMCGNPIFPGHPSSVGQFMPPMNAYTKLVHVLPSSGWLQDSPTYMQHNPMAELQHHQAHMWHQYQESLRPCADPSYMLHSHPPPYQETNGNDLQSHKKCKSQTDELLATKVENRAKLEKIERKVDSTFLPAEETVIVQNPFDGDDEVKLKKQSSSMSHPNGSVKALPDFNEAFGSTERGRFQSPPDPRLAPNKSYLDSFLLNDGIKFYDYHA